MEAILIKADSKSNEKLYKKAKKLGGSVYSIKEYQFEDFAFGLLLDKVKTGELVSKDKVMKKINKLLAKSDKNKKV